MIANHACPRCRGTLTRVDDIGETYFSCVQCGNTIYSDPAKLTALPAPSRWQGPEVADRADVRRRLIAKERARATARTTRSAAA
jgi:hypothetical protein